MNGQIGNKSFSGSIKNNKLVGSMNTNKFSGQINTTTFDGSLTNNHLNGSLHRPTGNKYPDYTGETEFYSNTENTQTVECEGKSMNEDIIIYPNEQLKEYNLQGGITVSII